MNPIKRIRKGLRLLKEEEQHWKDIAPILCVEVEHADIRDIITEVDCADHIPASKKSDVVYEMVGRVGRGKMKLSDAVNLYGRNDLKQNRRVG